MRQMLLASANHPPICHPAYRPQKRINRNINLHKAAAISARTASAAFAGSGACVIGLPTTR